MPASAPLPQFFTIRQTFESRRVADIPTAVHETLNAAGLAANLKPGAEVAIGVGSRGIANLDIIVRAVVDWWKTQGFRPFLFPAMGSHGAGTAAGQAAVLAKYGLTEESIGCPVRSSLAVIELGTTPDGIPVVMDRVASQAAGVMLCGRVKWHTDFAGALESGLFKMMAIGLGKFAGAKRYHTHGYNLGMEAVIRSVGRQVLASGRILGGLAILEDANHDTAHLEAVPAANMEQREEELLALVKTWMPRLPADLDVLMVNELGKNFSGAGLDTKIVNRHVEGPLNPWPDVPRVGRIFVRDLSPLSYGNATGIGMADVIHRRMLKKIKRQATYVNALTSAKPGAIRTPIYFKSDRECLSVASETVGRFDPLDVRIGWIANTLDLRHMAFSANLHSELAANPRTEILTEPRPLDFDSHDDLVNWLESAH
jgi:hypothetical protein